MQSQLSEPDPMLKRLDRLVGTWKITGGAQGKVAYEWMEGGYFLIQRVDLEQNGMKIKGVEIIGHERKFGEGLSEEIKSRFYDNMGDTFDYVYELNGDSLTIWAGEKGSPAFYQGKFAMMAISSLAVGSIPRVEGINRPPPDSSRNNRKEQ
jgi:hypothetical protein